MISIFWSEARRWAYAAAFLAFGAGCVSPPSTPDLSSRVSGASGIKGPLEWRVLPEPVDQPSRGSGSLTVAEAVRLALLHDPDLQAAFARVYAAMADAEQTRLLPNPVLSIAIRFPTDGSSKPDIDAGLTTDLLTLLQRPRKVSAADARLQSAIADALTTALDLLLDVQTTYVAVERLDAELVILRERKTLITRLLDVSRSRVRIGEAPGLDSLTLDSERLSLDVEYADKAAELRQHKLKLARLIGRTIAPIDYPLQVSEAVPELPGDENACITLALNYRPEVQSQRWQLHALGDEKALSGWILVEGAAAGVDSERDPDWAIGPAIAAPLPLFDWGQARRNRAAAAVIEARHKLVMAQRKVVEDVRQAIDAFHSAQDSLRTVRDEWIPLQKRRIEQVEAAYRNGLADSTTILIAEQESHAARQKVIDLQQRVSIARYRLDRAIGGNGIWNKISATQNDTKRGQQ